MIHCGSLNTPHITCSLISRPRSAWFQEHVVWGDPLVYSNDSPTWIIIDHQFSSVTQSCLTLCDPMIAGHHASLSITTPGVHTNPCSLSRWCHPTISSSEIPFSSCPQPLPASGSFPVSQLFESGGQNFGVSASTSVLPMNTQDWSPLGWTGWISLQSKGLSRVFSKPQFKNINSSALRFLYSPNLTSIHDHWKNHSLDQTDLCWQSNVFAF